jgi:hypothetical protein
MREWVISRDNSTPIIHGDWQRVMWLAAVASGAIDRVMHAKRGGCLRSDSIWKWDLLTTHVTRGASPFDTTRSEKLVAGRGRAAPRRKVGTGHEALDSSLNSLQALNFFHLPALQTCCPPSLFGRVSVAQLSFGNHGKRSSKSNVS